MKRKLTTPSRGCTRGLLPNSAHWVDDYPVEERLRFNPGHSSYFVRIIIEVIGNLLRLS
ncbi:MAG: hypothetical protein NUV68_07985 [Caldiserica bacterium]|nr:hypothetical protein [Caldisericota bacterium]MDH7563222.1 hypothetical protein [Caldisericota bacterium]